MKNNIQKIKLNFERFIDPLSPLMIALIVSLFFLIFYTIQIPTFTSNSDVLIYSSRSTAEKPILDYAFYNETILQQRSLLPNYHLGHTLILWSVYKIMPEKMRESIWPAGFISALCISISLGLTFLLFLRLGFTKNHALYISLISGIIPSIWFHALIGEVYAMQLLFVLLFAYSFYREKLFLSVLFFLTSVLITPISALSISFIFYRGFKMDVWIKGFAVAIISLIIYLGIYVAIGSNILDIARPLGESDETISFLKNKLKFGVIILLNIGFYLFFVITGSKKLYMENRGFLNRHIMAILPQLTLQLSYGGFNEELGSFHLILFWGFVPVIVYGLINSKKYFFKILAPLFFVFVIQYLWIQPNYNSGKKIYNAGKWLKKNYPEHIKILGDWESNVGLVQARLGWDINIFENNMFEHRQIGDKEIKQSGEDVLIVAISNRPFWRQLLAKIPINYFQIKNEFLPDNITYGHLEKIYENTTIALYNWQKEKETR